MKLRRIFRSRINFGSPMLLVKSLGRHVKRQNVLFNMHLNVNNNHCTVTPIAVYLLPRYERSDFAILRYRYCNYTIHVSFRLFVFWLLFGWRRREIFDDITRIQ